MTRSLCTLPRRVNFAVNKTWHQRQDVRLATTLYTGEPFAGDFDALPHATFFPLRSRDCLNQGPWPSSSRRLRISPSVMCGAAADATRGVGRDSSQYKRHLLQQIIFAKPIGSPQRVNQAPATIARSISSPNATPKRPRLDQSIIPKAKVKAVQELSVGFDLWTSPNRLAIMAVFAHFIDKFGNQQSRLLALRRQLGIHSGEDLAETLFEIVQLWDIRGQVGTVISDNATTTILVSLTSTGSSTFRSGRLISRPVACVLRPLLNLVARAFLFGKDAESFELESDING
ncbi:hypothetical protein ACKAV7_011891 [Fusarium commune]